MAMSELTKKRLHTYVAMPMLLIFAATLRAVCVSIFVLPYNFAPGGVTGIGAMIEYATGWFSTGYTTLIINAPLLVIAFIFIGKVFAVKSAVTIGLSSGLMILMKQFDIPKLVDEPVLAAVAAGVIGGVSLALLFRAGGSNGGTDIIAILIQRKYSAINLTWFIYGLDAIVMIASVFVYRNGLTPMLLSLTQEFSQSMMGDVISTGFKSALKYEIITDQPEELSQELIQKLHHSVTKMDAVGMYAHSEKAVLICVIRKRQLSEFNKILKKYPGTFAYMTSTNEVFGKGFSS